MHLSRLSTTEMASISQPYFDPSCPAHQALASTPEVATLLTRLREAHDVLAASQSADDVRADSLQKELAALVTEHDTLGQGLDYLCRGMSLLAEQDETRERWGRLCELLMPRSKGKGDASHQATADNAALLEQILEGLPVPDKGLLRGLFIGKRSLYDLTERWIAVGREIGRTETERQSIPVTPPDGALHDARNQWARIVGAMVAMFHMSELLGELSAGLQEHVLKPLRTATSGPT